MKMFRKLKDGTEVKQYPNNIVLQIVTKCPGKYKLVDMETGQEYIGQHPGMGEKVMHWKKVKDA